jgi:hypothetical protein
MNLGHFRDPFRCGGSMKRLANLTLVVVALAFAAPAQTSKGLTGNWTIDWLSGGASNRIELTQVSNRLSGTYFCNPTSGRCLDNKEEACTITGSVTDGRVAMHFQCSKFDLQLNGTLVQAGGQPADNEIDGTYLAYGDSTGKFAMKKVR